MPNASAPAPIRFEANQPTGRPYRGGLGISRLRGIPDADDAPEDFVASTTEIASGGGIGLSRLPDGTLLRDAVAADPVFYLGAEHVASYGASTELLVKLLDTGERLFVHFHPDDGFAAEHLHQPHGKTEAWIVTGVREAGYAYLGWNREVTPAEVDDWVASQRIDAMLAAMVRVDVEPGDVLFVPGGVPHSIGPGITLVELQQPSDLSVLLEYQGYPIDPADAFLGMERSLALSALDHSAFEPARDFDTAGASFFRAERFDTTATPVTLDAGYSILVVVDGTGQLSWRGGSATVSRGDTLLLPHALGAATLAGVTAIRCRPPAPR